MNLCAICRTFINPCLKVPNTYTTRCNHKFHASCLLYWMGRGFNSCPLCRSVVVAHNNNQPLQQQQQQVEPVSFGDYYLPLIMRGMAPVVYVFLCLLFLVILCDSIHYTMTQFYLYGTGFTLRLLFSGAFSFVVIMTIADFFLK